MNRSNLGLALAASSLILQGITTWHTIRRGKGRHRK